MLFLALSILCSVCILTTFKLAERFKIRSIDIIVINYFIAVAGGLIINSARLKNYSFTNEHWLIPAFIIGILFILNFYVMSLTTKRSGMTVTAISARISVVIPVLFSLFFYHENISILKIAGIIISIFAITLCIAKKNESGKKLKFVYLPVILFLMSGITDTCIKYTQARFLSDQNLTLFSVALFGIAAITGLLIYLFTGYKIRDLVKPMNLLFGIVLGLSNLGSMLFFIKTLNQANFDSSVIFSVNHLSVITLSVLTGLIAFREKLSLINWIGVFMAFTGIFVLYYSK